MSRIITACETIDPQQGSEIIERLYLLNRLSKTKAIHVLIDSPGGSVDTCLALFDLFRASCAPVYTYNIGAAYSGGFVLFLAGKKRFATQNCTFLIHPPQMLIDDTWVHPRDLKSTGVHGLQKQKEFVQLLSDNSKLSPTHAAKLVSRDSFFGLTKACKYGIVDNILIEFPTPQMLNEDGADFRSIVSEKDPKAKATEV